MDKKEEREVSIVVISDTHNAHDEVTDDLPEGDIIIHAGDISSAGYLYETKQFLDWFSKLDYKHKIFIAGNHDWVFEDKSEGLSKLLAEYPEVTYLENSSTEVEGVKIWGSPYTPTFYHWAFNVTRGKLDQHWSLIPEGTDIVVTHGPANGHGDDVPANKEFNNGTNAGCEQLLAKLEEIKPKFHIFGHIHNGYGVSSNEHTQFINAAVVNNRNRYANLPQLIRIKVKIEDAS